MYLRSRKIPSVGYNDDLRQSLVLVVQFSTTDLKREYSKWNNRKLNRNALMRKTARTNECETKYGGVYTALLLFRFFLHILDVYCFNSAGFRGWYAPKKETSSVKTILRIARRTMLRITRERKKIFLWYFRCRITRIDDIKCFSKRQRGGNDFKIFYFKFFSLFTWSIFQLLLWSC